VKAITNARSVSGGIASEAVQPFGPADRYEPHHAAVNGIR
jgi:hypothetical protein